MNWIATREFVQYLYGTILLDPQQNPIIVADIGWFYDYMVAADHMKWAGKKRIRRRSVHVNCKSWGSNVLQWIIQKSEWKKWESPFSCHQYHVNCLAFMVLFGMQLPPHSDSISCYRTCSLNLILNDCGIFHKHTLVVIHPYLHAPHRYGRKN